MKISVSLPHDDVDFLDRYARAHLVASRSAALHRAVALLRSRELEPAHAEAWAAWEAEGAAEAWDAVAADGLEPR